MREVILRRQLKKQSIPSKEYKCFRKQTGRKYLLKEANMATEKRSGVIFVLVYTKT